MKKLLLIFIITLTYPITIYSQTNDSNESAESTLIRINCKEIISNPLYVIKIANKKIHHRLNGKNYNESFLKELKPKWIDSANVLKVLEDLEKYGPSAEDGVILVLLKEDSWEKMSPELQNRFE